MIELELSDKEKRFIRQWRSYHNGSYATVIDKLIASAQSMQWIPCSERPPDRDGRYLITGKTGSVYSLDYTDGRWYGGISPVAWMILPKAYKEEHK